jgi:hypothetical protein
LYSTVRLLAFSFLVPAIVPSVLTAQNADKAQDENAAVELRQIGDEIAKAVLSKNISTLLTFDRRDLSWEDEMSLKDPQSPLFCYIFDSKCIPPKPKRRSIYEILSRAGSVGIRPILARSSRGYQEGLLVFYDASKVSNELLLSKGYLCKETGRTLATWDFRMVNGRWEAETPMFDSETDSPC